MNFYDLLYIFGGYFLGSILFAEIFGKIISKKDITAESPDRNPGTVNAFKYGGTFCGILTLCMDMLKGFLPVFLYGKFVSDASILQWSFVVAAPVIGHIFPIFNKFKGGKGIATSFGCLLGFLPDLKPALCLAVSFLLFSFIICITPNYYKTIFSYFLAVIFMLAFIENKGIVLGFSIINTAVFIRLIISEEEKEEFRMRLLWKH